MKRIPNLSKAKFKAWLKKKADDHGDDVEVGISSQCDTCPIYTFIFENLLDETDVNKMGKVFLDSVYEDFIYAHDEDDTEHEVPTPLWATNFISIIDGTAFDDAKPITASYALEILNSL